MTGPGDPKYDSETADMVMDLIQDTANAAHTQRTQIDEERRVEQQFMRQFPVALNEKLAGTGIFCDGVLPDGEGQGYVVYCADRVGRPYNAVLTFSEWLSTAERLGADAGREMVDVVAAKVIAARAKYFQRMIGKT